MRDFDFPPLILRDFTRDVSKDLVHELPSTPGLSSSPHSAVSQGCRPPRDHAPRPLFLSVIFA